MARKRKEDKKASTRIIERYNPALDRRVWRVWTDGVYLPYYIRPAEWKDFDTYEEALAYYHDLTGWAVVNEVAP